MKRLIGGVAAILVAGYCALWWYNASELRSQTLSVIQHINSSKYATFEFDHLYTGGFPFHINARFENAKLTINPNQAWAKPFDEKLTVDFYSSLALKTRPLSKSFSLSTDKTLIKSGQRETLQNGQLSLSLSFFENKKQPKSIEDLILNIQSLSYHHGKITTTNENHQEVVTAYPYRLQISRTQLAHNQENYQLKLNAKFVDEVVAEQLLTSSLPILGFLTPPTSNTPIPTSENNLINAEISVKTLALPTIVRWLKLGQVGQWYLSDELLHTPPKIDIHKLNFRTPWFNWSANFHSDMIRKAGRYNLSLLLHSKFTMNPQGQQSFEAILNKITLNNQSLATKSTQQTLLPNLAQMGTIQCDVDLKSTEQSIHIDKFNLNNQKYGVSGHVDIEHNKAGTAEFSIHNYTDLVDDAIHYIQALNELVNQTKITEKQITLDPKLAMHLNSSLRKLSTDPTTRDKNLTIKVHYDGRNFTIGSLNPEQVRQELSNLHHLITLNMQQPKPQTQPLPYINDQAFMRGIEYHRGRHVPVNYQEAVKWYQRAIKETGDERAMNNLAVLKAQGKGTHKDIKGAIELLQASADEGCNIAQLNLKSLTTQKSYPALVNYTSAFSFDITCEEYDEQSIDNMLRVFKVMGWHEIVFLRPGQPGAMPNSLRDYAQKRAVELGLTVLHHHHNT